MHQLLNHIYSVDTCDLHVAPFIYLSVLPRHKLLDGPCMTKDGQ